MCVLVNGCGCVFLLMDADVCSCTYNGCRCMCALRMDACPVPVLVITKDAGTHLL